MVERVTSIGSISAPPPSSGSPKKRGRGRPRIHFRPKKIKRPMSGAKGKLVALRMPEEMHEYLKSEAKRMGMSVSSLIRNAVLYLKNH